MTSLTENSKINTHLNWTEAVSLQCANGSMNGNGALNLTL